MEKGRRQFLRESGIAASLMPFLGVLSGLDAKAMQLPGQPRLQAVPDEEIDQSTLEFWTRQVRNPSPAAKPKPAAIAAPRNKQPTPLAGARRPESGIGLAPLLSSHAENEPAFFYFDKEAGFRRAHLLSPNSLPRGGDVEIYVQVLECRPSALEYERISKSESGSLRIDVQQAQPMPNLEEPLAWSALASLSPGAAGKASRDSSVDFDLGAAWGRTKRVPIPNGLGYWTWNLFLKEKDSPWSKMIDFIRAGSRLSSAYLVGLPAIGKTALSQVDELLGRVQAMRSSRWVFQSRDVEVYATRASRDRVGPRAVQLKTGEYVILPSSHVEKFEEAMERMAVIDGKIVPVNTPPSQLTRTAESVLPETTYLTVHVAARPKEFCRSPATS